MERTPLLRCRFAPILAAFILLAGCAGAEHSANAQRESVEAPSGEILFWSPERRRVAFRQISELFPTRTIEAATVPYPLTERLQDFSDVRYRVAEGEHTLASFLEKPETVSLIVVHKDNILLEHYGQGNEASSPWITFSVTKSITSLLIGAAIKDGYIESVDEPVVHYLPRLRGTAYQHSTIRDVLQMASGVVWDETYSDPNSDVARAGGSNGLELQRYLARLPLSADAGEVFNYNTGETNLAGEILRSAIGNNAATYLSRKIWQPFGMEHDANWMLGSTDGAELGGCCLNASLRDYARIGIFAMHGGRLPDGTHVLPMGWMQESTTPSTAYPGYGYLWWLGREGTYSALGIFGQMIFIDPANELVIAMHNNDEHASDPEFDREIEAVALAIREQVVNFAK